MTLGEVADWASIAALVVSGINTLLISSVKRRIILNVTLEPLLLRLRDNSLKINEYLLEDTEAAGGMNEVIGLCEADARALRRRFGFYHARLLRKAIAVDRAISTPW